MQFQRHVSGDDVAISWACLIFTFSAHVRISWHAHFELILNQSKSPLIQFAIKCCSPGAHATITSMRYHGGYALKAAENYLL